MLFHKRLRALGGLEVPFRDVVRVIFCVHDLETARAVLHRSNDIVLVFQTAGVAPRRLVVRPEVRSRRRQPDQRNFHIPSTGILRGWDPSWQFMKEDPEKGTHMQASKVGARGMAPGGKVNPVRRERGAGSSGPARRDPGRCGSGRSARVGWYLVRAEAAVAARASGVRRSGRYLSGRPAGTLWCHGLISPGRIVLRAPVTQKRVWSWRFCHGPDQVTLQWDRCPSDRTMTRAH
jgi:hypothetical protein